MSNKIKYLIGVSFIIITILISTAFSNPSISVSDVQPRNETIIVSGVGSIESLPDEANIIIAVVSESKFASDAAKMNAVNMTKIFAELNNAGITDVETIHYSITPIHRWVKIQNKSHEWMGEEMVIVGYRATNMIKVVCIPKDAGTAIDAAIRSGANRIDSISFQLSEDLREEVYNNALKNAINNARNKANVTAETIGIAKIDPIEITVIDEPHSYFYDRFYVPPSPMPPMAGGEISTPITPAEIKVNAQVRIVYAF